MCLTGKKLWLTIGVILTVLLIAAAVFFIFFLHTPASTLQPGSIFRGTDGVTIAAPEGALDRELEIYIKRIDDPRTEAPFPEFLSQTETVGEFYEITASEDFYTASDDYLLLGLPVPEGYLTDNLAIALLSPPEAIILGHPEDCPSFRWDLLRGVYDPESELLGTLFPYVGTMPQVVILVETDIFSRVEIENRGGRYCRDTAYFEGTPRTGRYFPCTVLSTAGGITGALMLSTGALAQTFSQVAVEAGTAVDLAAHYNSFASQSTALEIEGFQVSCLNSHAWDCTADHIQLTEDALYDSYVNLMNMGFQEPRLRRVVTDIFFSWGQYTVLPIYEYGLREGDPNGAYFPSTRTIYTTYPGLPESPDPRTARHELFHAFQFGYDAVLDNWNKPITENRSLWGFIEGTTVASELSLPALTRSNAQRVDSAGNITNMISREPLSIGVSLLQNTVFNWATANDYRTQDFWVYIGMRMNPVDQRVNYFIPFFERGGLLADIDTVLREEGTFESLADAYWQWVKNHSFEKQVILGPDHEGEPVPNGGPGSWSGHGDLRVAVFNPFTWTWSSNATNFSLFPLQSRAYQINLEPAAESYVALVAVDSPDPDIMFKIYLEDDAGSTDCWDESRDNTPQAFVVDGEGVTGYLLVSNTSTSRRHYDISLSTLEYTHDLSNIAFSPHSPAVLPPGERVEFTFDYRVDDPGGVRIFGRPFTGGSPTPGYGAHRSPLYGSGEGSGEGFFIVNTEATVDQVRFQVWDAGQQSLYYETFIPVNFEFKHIHEIDSIVLSPKSPGVMAPGEHVDFTFSYMTTQPGGVRIFGRPFTGGSPAPGYAAHGSPLHDSGKGHGSGHFTLNSDGNVDQIRFQMWDAGQQNLLFETFVPVSYTFEARHSIELTSLNPPSPATLYVNSKDRVYFTFNYFTTEPGGVRIFGRPFVDGEIAPSYSAHGSTIMPAGEGKGEGFFAINTPKTDVDQIRFQMWDADQNNLLFEIFFDVKYTFY